MSELDHPSTRGKKDINFVPRHLQVAWLVLPPVGSRTLIFDQRSEERR